MASYGRMFGHVLSCLGHKGDQDCQKKKNGCKVSLYITMVFHVLILSKVWNRQASASIPFCHHSKLYLSLKCISEMGFAKLEMHFNKD